jgi:hypothetical protein
MARAQAHADLLGRADAERASVTQEDDFAPHGMVADVLTPIRDMLAGERSVRKAYAMRKCVEHVPELAMHVIVLETRHGPLSYNAQAKNRALVKRLAETLPLPGRGYIVVVGSKTRWLLRRARKTGDSLIYSRSNRSEQGLTR